MSAILAVTDNHLVVFHAAVCRLDSLQDMLSLLLSLLQQL